MSFKDLRDFIDHLESIGQLKRISHPVDPDYEMTEISDRTLRAGGPALLFENPVGYDMPVLTNLFGTPNRVAIGMGRQEVKELREVGKLLAYLKEPEPPKGFKDALDKLPVFKQVLNMPAKRLRKAACQQVVWQAYQLCCLRAGPRSLAATRGISVDFFSSGGRLTVARYDHALVPL